MLKKVKKKKIAFSTILNEISNIKNCDYDLMARTIYFKYKINVNEFIQLYNFLRVRKKFNQDTIDFISTVTCYLSSYDYELRVDYNTNLKPLLISFIESDCYDEKDFFTDKNLLEKILEYAFILDYDFYNRFFDVLEEKKNKLQELNIREGKQIINLIDSGILISNDSYREFDFIDYYMNTKLPPKKMVLLLRKYADSDKLILFKMFASRYDNDYVLKESDIERRLSDRTFFNCFADENGNLIEGTGFEISDSDKIFVLEYLKNNNVPITECTYSAGLQRFKNGFFVHKEKKLVLK